MAKTLRTTVVAKTAAEQDALRVLTDDAISKRMATYMGGLITSYVDDRNVDKQARDAAKAAGEVYESRRVKLLLDLAKFAADNNCTGKYAVAGVDLAIKAYDDAQNDPSAKGTLTTLANECKRCVHPDAAAHVADTYKRVVEAWNAEGEALKASKEAIAKEVKEITSKGDEAKAEKAEIAERHAVDTPLRDAYPRAYQAAFATNGAIASYAKPTLADIAGDPEALAESVLGDNKRDKTRAARAIAKAVATITEIAAEFPAPEWADVLDFLAGADADYLASLAKARKDAERKAARDAERAANASADANPKKWGSRAKRAQSPLV